MGKVILDGHVIVPDADLKAVLNELPNHIEKTRAEGGCIVFRVGQCLSNPNRLDVYEEFVDEASFKAHQERVRRSKWGQVAKNCERHYDIVGL